MRAKFGLSRKDKGVNNRRNPRNTPNVPKLVRCATAEKKRVLHENPMDAKVVWVGNILKRIGKSYDWFKPKIKERNGSRFFVILDVNGEEKWFRLYRASNRRLYLSKDDSERLVNLVRKRNEEFLTVEQVAQLTSKGISTLESWIDAKSGVLKYMLPNRDVFEVRKIKDGCVNYFLRSDLEAALEKGKAILRSMRFYEDIVEEVGMGNALSIRQFFNRVGHSIKFTLNGKRYEVEIKEGVKDGHKKMYIFDHEFASFVKYYNMRCNRTHVRLFAHDNVHGLSMNRKHKLRNIIDEKERRLLLYQDNTIVIFIPLDELNGDFYISKDHLDLFRFYRDIALRSKRKRIAALEELNNPSSKHWVVKLILAYKLYAFEKNKQVRAEMRAIFSRFNASEIVKHRVISPFTTYVVRLDFSNPRVCLDINYSRGFVVLSREYGIVVPVHVEEDGITVDVRDTVLLKMYEDLFYGGVAEACSHSIRYIDTLHEKLNKGERLDTLDIAGLWIIRDFAIKNLTEFEKEIYYLLDKLSNLEFKEVWEMGHDNLGRYSLGHYRRRE